MKVVSLTQSDGLKTFKYNYNDVAWVHKTDIITILPTPTVNKRSVIFDNDILL